jgi:hypothetical protein
MRGITWPTNVIRPPPLVGTTDKLAKKNEALSRIPEGKYLWIKNL